MKGTDGVRLRSAHLPPHEDVVAAVQLLVVKVIRVEAFGVLAKWLELTLQRGDSVVKKTGTRQLSSICQEVPL